MPVPEFTADVGIMKGEKVDYAVLRDGKPIMLFECKAYSSSLSKGHASQLYRYFSVTEARFGVLTNGVEYRFYSDLEYPNRMDNKPFFEVDIQSLDDGALSELRKFSRKSFDLDGIIATASDLKYTREIKRIMAAELEEPSDDFVRFFGARVYEGKMTKNALSQFSPITKRALGELISERVSARLKSALATEEEQQQESDAVESEDTAIRTTEAEIEGYLTVKAILAETIDPRRIVMRDQQSYCSVILDDNNRKPICRLWFNSSKKYLGTFDENKNETRNAISDTNGIFGYADHLRATARRYG